MNEEALPRTSPPIPQSFRRELEELREHYPTQRGALLPILTRLQEEHGHVSTDDMRLAADITGLSAAEVFSVTSFYTMYRQSAAGAYPLGICRNISCWLSGAERLVGCVQNELGIGPGETTSDGKFSLEEVECLGSCGTAPAMEIHGHYFEQMTPEKLKKLLDKLRNGSLEVTPSSPLIR